MVVNYIRLLIDTKACLGYSVYIMDKKNISTKKITSAQIAKLAGVSRSTVSRVINGYDNVNKRTHDKIMKVIRENNYHPHLSGQLLVGKKSRTLGFFWIKTVGAKSVAENELSSAYLVHVVEAAARLGYLTLTCILDDLTNQKNITWVNRTFMEGRIDAGIFIGVDNDEPFIENLIAGGNTVGMFDHYHQNKTEPNRISVNYEENTGGKIIDYLHSLGHKKIALIHGDETRYSSVKRKESFLKAMKRHGIEIKPEWMSVGGIDEDKGYHAAKDMFLRAIKTGNLPTAVCANNDAVAFGVYRALKELNIEIPDQISITGIDGHIRVADPPLTTYSFDYKEVFTSLVSRTIAAIEQKQDYSVTEFIKGRLIKRKSCKKV